MASNNLVWFIFLPLVASFPNPPYKAPVPDVDHLYRYAHDGLEKRPDVIVLVRERPEEIHSDPYAKHSGDSVHHDPYAKHPGDNVHNDPYAKHPGDSVHYDPYAKHPVDNVHYDPYAKHPGDNVHYDSYAKRPYAEDKPVYVAKGDLSGKEKVLLDHVLSGGYKQVHDYHGGPGEYYGPHDTPSYGFGGFHDDDDDDDDDFDGFPFPLDADDYRRR